MERVVTGPGMTGKNNPPARCIRTAIVPAATRAMIPAWQPERLGDDGLDP